MQEIIEKKDLPHTESYKDFLKSVEQKEEVEGKIRLCLDFMKEAVSKEKTPAFRDFWAAKHLCLEFFKKPLPNLVRAAFWNEYIELSEQIKKVKAILDEQASFTEQQVELAIEALEKDLEGFESHLKETEKMDFPSTCKALEGRQEFYIGEQCTITLLNLYASRLNSLRKELVETRMRVSRKNRLFKRLSHLGDHVFPKRKEKIKSISEGFQKDVEKALKWFESSEMSLFSIREEIKALQGVAKALSLSTSAFKSTRESLSQIWNALKEKEAENKKTQSAKQEEYKQNFDAVVKQIEELPEGSSEADLNQKIEEIQTKMRALKLGRNEVKTLKSHLDERKKPFEEERRKRAEAENEKAENEKKKRNLLQSQLEEIHKESQALSLDGLVEKYENFLKEAQGLFFEEFAKEVIDSLLNDLKDQIEEKKWEQLLKNDQETSRYSAQQILEDRHNERIKIKETLEEYRRIVGRSNLSFEQAMLIQDLIEREKKRLEAIETLIEEIESK